MTDFVESWRRLGLRILPPTWPSLVIAVCAGLTLGAYRAIADVTIFAGAIGEMELQTISKIPALARILIFIPACITDELIFRLVVVSTIAWLLTLATGERVWCYWTAILITALAIYPAWHIGYLQTLTPSTMVVLRQIFTHGCAGILWGYLYWRFGLLASILGHIGEHVSLEPLTSLLLGA
ncbi:CPBP family glutamic-type intramembrane protease [Mesorhizobium atlanticum]|uniref:CAAX prenyl protease 2/Lysostaphin resistance protein A-like domain-containing protein n=1 Tax=Mesorhizobium atlanticum TaxID=2233532 RepID=A0A330GFH4_9HYPH|nr:CPBP family glutamic-type intramembrane protease [Mesorhizobium atlanticum]RAZ71384.1 hypothetical protein DPM35_30920 [Mesorhizobium atlanticum]